jgi:hypothetical protein
VATWRRRIGAAGAVAAGMLVLGGTASTGAAQPPVAEPPHGQLRQAADGTLYLLVAGRAHPITPAPLTDDALAVVPPGEALPDGAFWLMPAAAPPGPAQAATPRPSVAAFFATQTAVAPRGVSRQRAASTVVIANTRVAPPRQSTPVASRAVPASAVRPLGQS